MGIQDFKDNCREIGWFVLYIITKPFIELWNFLKSIVDKSEYLDLPKTWIPIYGILALVGIYLKNDNIVIACTTLLIFTSVHFIYEQGDWKYAARMKARQNIKNKVTANA